MHRENSFDLLRLFAAIAVLFSHGYPLANQRHAEPIAALTHYGNLGQFAVNVFFIISGYLVTQSYLRSSNPLEYLTKRALRIFPALWFVIILTIFIFGPLLTTLPLYDYYSLAETHTYIGNVWLNFQEYLPGVFENNPDPGKVNGSLWTLPYEAYMYGIVLLLGISKLLTRRGCIFMILLFSLIYGVTPVTKHPDLWIFAVFGLFYFLGALYNFLGDIYKNKYLVFGCLAILFIFANASFAHNTIAFIVLPTLVIYCGRSRSALSRWITQQGDYSYGLYIWGFLIEQTVAQLLGQQVTPLRIFLISLPITFLFAAISWHFIEKPVLDRKHYALAFVRNMREELENRLFGRGERI